MGDDQRLGAISRTRGIFLATLTILLLLLLAQKPAAAAGETTDLIFLVDGSGSIDATDWGIQKAGLSAALADAVAFPQPFIPQ